MKTIQSIKSSSQLKSAAFSKQRSIPVAQRSAQTELYMLRKEKQRYLKEIESIKKRYDHIKERLGLIDEEMLELSEIWRGEVDVIEKEASETMLDLDTKDKRKWKKRKLKY